MTNGSGHNPSDTIARLDMAKSASATATAATKIQNRSFIERRLVMPGIASSPGSSSRQRSTRGHREQSLAISIPALRPGPGASARPAGLIEAVAQLLAGLEERDVLLRDLDAVTGARVAPDPGVPAFH